MMQMDSGVRPMWVPVMKKLPHFLRPAWKLKIYTVFRKNVHFCFLA